MKADIAHVAAAQVRVEDTVIRASFSGRTGFRQVSVGSLVNPGTVITTLDDIRVIKLDFTVPETYLFVLRRGLPVIASATGLPDHKFEGQVTNIESRVDPITRSITVRAELPNPDRHPAARHVHDGEPPGRRRADVARARGSGRARARAHVRVRRQQRRRAAARGAHRQAPAGRRRDRRRHRRERARRGGGHAEHPRRHGRTGSADRASRGHETLRAIGPPPRLRDRHEHAARDLRHRVATAAADSRVSRHRAPRDLDHDELQRRVGAASSRRRSRRSSRTRSRASKASSRSSPTARTSARRCGSSST